MINKESEGIVANPFDETIQPIDETIQPIDETIQPNYEEKCRKLTAENSRLLCIFEEQKKEIQMLRTIKATVECICGRKIDIGK